MSVKHTLQFGKLILTVDATDAAVVYQFSGDVDESFRQKDVPRLKHATVVIDTGDIRMFNSCGIREWVYLVRDLAKLGQLVFRRCSVAMIDQINMVPDTLLTGKIESFFAPYFCPCSGEVNRLIDITQHGADLASAHAPALMCEKCQKPLEFDALEESYFLFLKAPIAKAS